MLALYIKITAVVIVLSLLVLNALALWVFAMFKNDLEEFGTFRPFLMLISINILCFVFGALWPLSLFAIILALLYLGE